MGQDQCCLEEKFGKFKIFFIMCYDTDPSIPNIFEIPIIYIELWFSYLRALKYLCGFHFGDFLKYVCIDALD